MYRVHDQPSAEKIHALADFLASIGLRFAKGQPPTPLQFNQILKKTAATAEAHMVSGMVLRSQAQAEYNPDNIGHFGLALHRYAHFTSPIRRYADLLVHRGLIAALGLGDDGNNDDDLATLGRHLSSTERRASAAERSTFERLTAAWLENQVGGIFAARVNGVTRAGLFVTLTETGADGLIPMRTLPDDYYRHDAAAHTLTGERRRLCFRLGQALEVSLVEAVPVTGGMIFTLAHMPKPSAKTSHKPRRSQKHGRKKRRRRR
jgi:ribonuclease R